MPKSIAHQTSSDVERLHEEARRDYQRHHAPETAAEARLQRGERRGATPVTHRGQNKKL
ncbi:MULTISPECIES: hypothetical protein [Streptomyces]|uniref:Uncharacterized protein n=1 Tax=Streptomyces aureoversilis TaxID=67277 RepID=A0ABW0A7L9_9ACTN